MATKMDRMLESAKQHFESGEEPSQAVLGTYESELVGGSTHRTGILVATDRRLILYAKRRKRNDFEVIPYARISSIEMGKTWWMGHYVKFLVSGYKCKMGWIDDGDVLAFVDTVKHRIENVRPSSDSPSGSSPAGLLDQSTFSPFDILQELGRLHESGILTNEEFASKKAEILARI